MNEEIPVDTGEQNIPPVDTSKPADNAIVTLPAKRVIGRPFEKGNKMSKGGNQYLAEINRLRSAMYRECKTADIKDICRAAIDKAKGDPSKHKQPDPVWARIVLEYLVPKPKQEIDIKSTNTNLNISPEEIAKQIDAAFGLDVNSTIIIEKVDE